MSCPECHIGRKRKYPLKQRKNENCCSQCNCDFLFNQKFQCFHCEGKKVENKTVNFNCEECSFSCSSTNILKEHSSIHNVQKTFYCVWCKRQFGRKEYLELHLQICNLVNRKVKKMFDNHRMKPFRRDTRYFYLPGPTSKRRKRKG